MGHKLNGIIKKFWSCSCGDSTGVVNCVVGGMPPIGVRLLLQDQYVVLDNGILQLTLSNPDGIVTGISYNGVDNLLEVLNNESNRGYWDVVWNALDGSRSGVFEVIKGTIFKVIKEDENQIEVSFSRPWDPSLQGKLVPLNIDKRFILLRGCSGFYSYAIYEHVGSTDWPGFSLGETRIAFKLRKDKFQYMAVADNRKRVMPLPDDRLPGRGQPLAYPEAVLLVNPVNPMLKGEVDDKYQYSCDNKDNKVHGWISMEPPVGFWLITPSDEFRSGGPLKQNLTSHVGPTTLSVFLSAHYAGDALNPKFGEGEPWKKVFGPVFIYVNSVMGGQDPLTLWDDAKRQMQNEVQSWPYSFPASEDFLSADQRGNVNGKLLISDRFISSDNIPAKGAYVGLAPPGDPGSWQRECKDYQFWTIADETGHFSINNVRPGNYNLYAWVPGFIGDYRNEASISINPGDQIEMGDMIFELLRDGPTLWEIGIPDRTAAEFYVPDPDPKYVNKLFVNHPPFVSLSKSNGSNIILAMAMAMAETQTKRPREEPPTLLDDSKRHRPYTPILDLLDDADEDNELILDPSQDLSATIFSTLQQELSTSAFPHPPPANGGDDDEDDAVKSVMRHLLEASDDELGIPIRATTDDDDDNNKNKSHETLNSSAGDFPYDLDGLWEFEDEAENYYTASHSELLM